MFWKNKNTQSMVQPVQEVLEESPHHLKHSPTEESSDDALIISENKCLTDNEAQLENEVPIDRVIFSQEEKEELFTAITYLESIPERDSWSMRYGSKEINRFNERMQKTQNMQDIYSKYKKRVIELYEHKDIQTIIAEYESYLNIVENSLMIPVILSQHNTFSKIVHNFKKGIITTRNSPYLDIDEFLNAWSEHKASMLAAIYDVYSRDEVSSIEEARVFFAALNKEYEGELLSEGQYLGLKIKYLTLNLSFRVSNFHRFVTPLIIEYNNKFEDPYYAENFNLNKIAYGSSVEDTGDSVIYLPQIKKTIVENKIKKKSLSEFEPYKIIIEEFKTYQIDLVKMMSKPILADFDDVKVNAFYLLCLEIERSESDISVIQFEIEWAKLKSYADKQQVLHLNDNQYSKFEDSKVLLSKAFNDESTINEKELSIKALERKLMGVLPLNSTVINNLKQQVGLRELEM